MDNRIPTTRNLTGAELYSVGAWKHPAKPKPRPYLIRGIIIGAAAALGVVLACAVAVKAQGNLAHDLRTIAKLEALQ